MTAVFCGEAVLVCAQGFVVAGLWTGAFRVSAGGTCFAVIPSLPAACPQVAGRQTQRGISPGRRPGIMASKRYKNMEDLADMNRRNALIAYVLIACTLVLALISRAAETRQGSWTITRSDEPGKVSFVLIYHSKHNNSNHQADWPLSDFKGIDFSKSGKQDVKFVIGRDAGGFDCEGYLNNGEGAGTFHFSPNAQYNSQMNSLGFTGIDDDKQFSMAILDVSVAYAKEMKSLNIKGLDTDKLIAFRIFNVSREFVEELRKAGLPATDADKLVAFRIHGVSPEMVAFVHQAGYQPDEDTLVAMRIHGVSPEFMQQLKKEGYDRVDLQKLIAFRIHGVSPEFIEKLQTLGYQHPEPDQLVAMRIHNVSPEFISDLKSRGMKNLTIDQLVNLRIHGID
jgi:hypothetical protein